MKLCRQIVRINKTLFKNLVNFLVEVDVDVNISVGVGVDIKVGDDGFRVNRDIKFSRSRVFHVDKGCSTIMQVIPPCPSDPGPSNRHRVVMRVIPQPARVIPTCLTLQTSTAGELANDTTEQSLLNDDIPFKFNRQPSTNKKRYKTQRMVMDDWEFDKQILYLRTGANGVELRADTSSFFTVVA
ncbi:hypothetical protein BC829DRAFT_417566 [Chytridium lagenaria]|nr:hypothetical protein BC829DRAFT_417566 [Chytridium lagenaria]